MAIIEVVDFNSSTDSRNIMDYDLPSGLETLEVTVDNGRLGIYINGELVYTNSSLTDASVLLTKE